MSGDLTVSRIVRKLSDELSPRYGAGEAKAMVRMIFGHLKGWSAVDLAVKANEHITPFMQEQIDVVVSRLKNNEPIQYIFGSAYFYGMEMKVTCDTLIPRPETAELVDMIVKDNEAKDLRVLDVCTGSGCIAVALARNLLFPSVTAVDISAGALAVARENAAKFHTDVNFIRADVLSEDGRAALVNSEYDIIVSNPPYIAESEKSGMDANVLDYEPHIALFVPDSDPLEFYSAIFDMAERCLSGNGRLYFEINPLFADRLVQLAAAKGFHDAVVFRDTDGKQRFLRASR